MATEKNGDELLKSFFIKADENHNKLQEKLTNFSNEKKELEMKLERINKLVKMYSEEKDAIRESLNAEKKSNEEYKIQIDNLSKQIKDSEEKYSNLKKEKDKIETEHEKKEKLIKKLHATNTLNKAEFDQLTKDIQKLNSEKRRNNKRIGSLEGEVDASTKREVQLCEKIQEFEKQIAMNEDFKKKIDELQIEIKNLTELKLDLEDKNKLLEKNVIEIKNENLEAANYLNKLNLQIQEYEEKCKQLTVTKDELQSQVDMNSNKFSEELKALEEENKENMKKFEDWKSEKESFLKANEEQCKIYELKIRLREEKIRILEDKLKNSTQISNNDEKTEELWKVNQNLSDENLKQSKTIDSLMKKLKEFERNYNEESKKINYVEQLLSEAQKENGKLLKDNLSKDQKIKELVNEIEYIANMDYDVGKCYKRARLEVDENLPSKEMSEKIKELEEKLKTVVQERDKMLEDNIKQMDYIDQMNGQWTRNILK